MDYNPKVYASQNYEVEVDYHALSYIVDNISNIQMGRLYDPHTNRTIDVKSEPSLLYNFANDFKCKKGTRIGRRVDTYTQSKKNPRRMTTTKTSLQGIPRVIRHTITRNNMFDIDIVNCHPMILEGWCIQKGILCDLLKDYNKNRPHYFKQIQTLLGWTKDETKTFVLKFLNGGGKGDKEVLEKLSALPWFHPFINQLDMIRNRVCDLYPELREMAKKSKEDRDGWNIEGTTLSYLLCNLENQCLQQLVQYCQLHGVKISSLIFDGLMVYKNSVKDIDQLCQQLQEILRKVTGWELEVTHKEMNEGIEIPEHYKTKEENEEDQKIQEKERKLQEEREHKEILKQEKKREEEMRAKMKEDKKKLKIEAEQQDKEEEEKEYFKIKEQFEENHCKIIETSNFIIETEMDNNIFKKKDQMVTSYEHMRYGDNKTFIRAWFVDPTIRRYQRMETIPNGVYCPPDTYNLWTPFTIFEKYDYKEDKEGCDFFVNHIKQLLPNESVHDWMFKWMSHLLQYPSKKSGVRTPFLISEQGAGKDSLIQLLRALMGNCHILETSKPSEQVWGKFNDLMTGNTYLVVLNELSRAETIGAEEHIKMLQTEGEININPKNNSPYTIKSYHRFIGLTNKEDPLGTSKGDRRNLFFRCCDNLIGNAEHFEKFYGYLNNKDTIYTFYHWLLQYKPDEVKSFHTLTAKELPILEYQEEMAELNIDHLEMFIQWLVNESDYLKSEMKDGKYEPTRFSASSLLQAFTQFKEQYGLKYECNAISLKVKLSRKKIKGIEKHKTNTCNYTIINYEMLKDKYLHVE
jgi:hypothetical protein